MWDYYEHDKPTFDGKLKADLIWEDGQRKVVLHDSFAFRSVLFKSWIVAPKGFKSDGASVPRFFWRMFPPFDLYLESAVIHDILCVRGKAGKGAFDYKEAALIFKEAMEFQGVAKWKVAAMYRAVLYFGPKFKAA